MIINYRKQEEMFKEIENIVRDYAVFTTSEETDVKELIRDGYSIEEICLIIRHW